MKKDKLNAFACYVERAEPLTMVSMVAVAYNRGHAAKLIAKKLEEYDIKLTKDLDTIEEIDLTKESVRIVKWTIK
jgi:hypothetical protein